MEEQKNSGLIDDRNKALLAYLTLSRDKKFFRISEADRLELITSVQAFGEGLAKEIKQEFGTSDPRRIVEMMGLRVVGEDKGIRGTLLKRSEYRPREKQIIIYRDSLNQLMKEVATEDLSDKLMKLLIAHELFHHLEITKRLSIPKRFRAKRWSLGPLGIFVSIRATSEVAAHSFAEELLDLKQSPMVFDYLTYIFYSGRRGY